MINSWEVNETNKMVEQEKSGRPYDHDRDQSAGVVSTRIWKG